MLALPPSEGMGIGIEGNQTSTIKQVVGIPNNSVSTQMKQSTQTGMPGESKVDAGAQPTRDYNELMDQYSLHQIIIRKGQVLDTTPEFISFRRTYLNKWGSVSYILHLIQRLLTDSDVDMAYVEGRKVALLATAEMDLKKPSKEDLYDCIVNKDEVASRIKIPSMMFKGQEGPIFAATVIQKNWRSHKARVAYTYLKFLMQKATII